MPSKPTTFYILLINHNLGASFPTPQTDLKNSLHYSMAWSFNLVTRSYSVVSCKVSLSREYILTILFVWNCGQLSRVQKWVKKHSSSLVLCTRLTHKSSVLNLFSTGIIASRFCILILCNCTLVTMTWTVRLVTMNISGMELLTFTRAWLQTCWFNYFGPWMPRVYSKLIFF